MNDVYLCIYYSAETGNETIFVEEKFEDIFDGKKHPGLEHEDWGLVAPDDYPNYTAIIVRPCGDRITIQKQHC